MSRKMRWDRARDGQVPKDAICGGWDATSGEPLFVGRASHDGVVSCGKVHPSHRCLYIPYGESEHKKQEYEVLVNPGNSEHVEWIHCKDGEVPPGAMKGGDNYYVGRASHHGNTICGKVHLDHKCLYISHGGKAIPKKEYEVLSRV